MKTNDEQKIWDYLDGLLSENETKAIEMLIQEDEAYQKAYESVRLLRNSLNEFKLSDPSPNLSVKLLEAYKLQYASGSQFAESSINKRLVNSILGFLFTMPVIVVLIYLVKNPFLYKIDMHETIGDVITGSPLIWLVILLNGIFLIRFMRKRYELRSRYNL